ncbi:hypothetical protein GLOIN_2v1780597 [Rhizophagus clarus]|uniref:Uncharacterized protein n=1 Tax=Rhizophagus clarus TaxID=94130 RepID=A0A8H3M587_9GLOM|nr:hypothetical protein GLOIN_2v1780597 [Rhizophagus clarus]
MSNGSSIGNLNRHLTKVYLEKVNPSIEKQVKFMKKFTQSTEQILFFNEVFYEKLSEWIVTDDQLFTVVESPEFHALINICNLEANIPLAGTVKSNTV